MPKREAPEINAGSMADIAFLLLIFFLVTTTMDVDSGIARKLPPYDENPPETPPQMVKNNLLAVLVNANDEILVNEEYMELRDLRAKAVEFIDNNLKGDCDYCQGRRDAKMSENPEKHIISLQNDRGTSYEMYIAVQNELTGAYNELRDRLAQSRHGRAFNLLNEEDAKQIAKDYPVNISEAEPIKLN